jgi:hypothetical protein
MRPIKVGRAERAIVVAQGGKREFAATQKGLPVITEADLRLKRSNPTY